MIFSKVSSALFEASTFISPSFIVPSEAVFLIELLPTINFFNDIAGAFSWQSILAYSIGVPTVLISVTLLIIKLYIKHKKL